MSKETGTGLYTTWTLESVGAYLPSLKQNKTHALTHLNLDTVHQHITHHITFIIIQVYTIKQKGTNLGFLAARPSCEAGPLLLLGLDLDFGLGEGVPVISGLCSLWRN